MTCRGRVSARQRLTRSMVSKRVVGATLRTGRCDRRVVASITVGTRSRTWVSREGMEGGEPGVRTRSQQPTPSPPTTGPPRSRLSHAEAPLPRAPPAASSPHSALCAWRKRDRQDWRQATDSFLRIFYPHTLAFLLCHPDHVTCC